MEKAMSVDKKAEGDKIHFILPQSIGHVVIKDLTAKEAIDLTSGGTVICII
jgi:3-dehydroquinate synthetase